MDTGWRPEDIERIAREILVASYGNPGLFMQVTNPPASLFSSAALALHAPAGAHQRASSIWAPPVTGPVPGDLIAVYLTLWDYCSTRPAKEGSEAGHDVIRSIVGRYARLRLLEALAILNHLTYHPDQLDQFVQGFRDQLTVQARARLDAAMRPADGQARRAFFSRQMVLGAIKEVLRAPEPPADGKTEPAPPIVAATILAHAVAAASDQALPAEGQEIGRVPAALAMELIRNAHFYRTEDRASAIGRRVRLWRDYGARLPVAALPARPVELLRAATGLELEDLMALGLAVYTHALLYEPTRQIWLPDDLNSAMSRKPMLTFYEFVGGTLDELSAAAAGSSDGPWHFLALQLKPVLRHDGQLLVLDEGMLLDRILHGPYWMVHEHERARAGSAGWQRWTRAYGAMVELMVEDLLRPLAPRLLGTSGTTFYSEEDLDRAYRGKKADAVIDFGGVFCLVEVVSGQLTVGTRIEGEVTSFEGDVEKLVLKKARQLDETGQAILDDPSVLTGVQRTAPFWILPIIIASEGFPVTPITVDYVASELRDRGLFRDARMQPLAILDMGELEMIAGLSERGEALPRLVTAWQQSGLAKMPFRIYALERFGSREATDFRPAVLATSADAAFGEVVARLKLKS